MGGRMDGKQVNRWIKWMEWLKRVGVLMDGWIDGWVNNRQIHGCILFIKSGSVVLQNKVPCILYH